MGRWVVCYDVPDDRRRNKVAEILDDYGDRVQYSVFEVQVAEEHFNRMVRRLRAVLDNSEDSVRIYPACQRCAAGALVLGRRSQPPAWQEQEGPIII